ncbi:MAG: ribonuclease PH [Eubacteriales bacterium]|nr:ribonuclease PH [Eubacteriales bacterium]
MERIDGRSPQALRRVQITPNFVGTAFGSCLMETGGTRVIATASVEKGVPAFLRGKGQGWLTAEYAMLPASTGRRKQRDGLKKDSRGVEISRLIGRSLRQAVDLRRLGEHTVTIDCDVLEADGGTRTAAITGGFVALALAVDQMIQQGMLKESPINHQVAAVSCGVVEGKAILDLNYSEDSHAEADMNFVLNEAGDLVEIQGTGEGKAFPVAQLQKMLRLSGIGIRQLMECQLEALGKKACVVMQPQTLVLASSNAHKIRELSQLLGSRFQILSMGDAGFEGEVEETGGTYAENAALKAEAVRDATGYMALGDDSGLEVAALHGAPGLRSARYAGQHGDDDANNKLLLKNLEGEADRAARFVTVLALASPFGPTRYFEGICVGSIAREPMGEGGFGYDPVFLYENDLTFAQMGEVAKNQVSHRARALGKLKEALG